MLERLETVETGPGAAERLGLESGSLGLVRAWPRGTGRLGLEYEDGRGNRVAGQWLADRAALERVAADTVRRTPPGAAELVDRSPARVLLQAGGADRRLSALGRLAAAPDATLVAHRPERRGVVRRPGPDGGIYAKVLRPERSEAAAERIRRMAELAKGAFAVPRLAGHDRESGTIELSALAGEPLHRLLGGADAMEALARVGAALGALQRRPPPGDLPRHGFAEEIVVLRRWIADLTPHRPAFAAQAAAVAPAVERNLATEPSPDAAILHRDLHDKQVLLAPSGQVALLDLDGVARGEGALDLANLAAHLELRVLQEQPASANAGSQIGALLDAADPPADVRRRLDAYLQASRLRLACVYAFRPQRRDVASALLEAAAEARPYALA